MTLTAQSQVLSEKFVYMPQRVYASCHAMSSVAFIWLHHRFVSDWEFLGRRYENTDTKAAALWGVGTNGLTDFSFIRMIHWNRRG